ncbi:MAG: hypothetical protein AB7H80_00280 [Candidatus Kapaibacterium sp.]
MNRIEREELLRRYLEGEMNLQGEHDFFIQVALDKELRHELKAQQTIERAFQKDRVSDSVNYSTIQAGVTAMLATLPQSPAEAESVEAPPSKSTKSNLYRYLFGAGIFLLLGITFFTLNFSGETTLMRSVAPEMQEQGTQLQQTESTVVSSQENNNSAEPMDRSGDVEVNSTERDSEHPKPHFSRPSRSNKVVTSPLSKRGDVNENFGKSDSTTPETNFASQASILESTTDTLNNTKQQNQVLKQEDSIKVGAKLEWKNKPINN